MRKVMLATMAVMLCAGVAMAEAGKSKACSKKPSATGEVTAIDAAAGKLTIKGPKDAVSDWTIPAGVKIAKPGKKDATLADIAVGDTVTVCFDEANGVKTVTSIKVRPQRKGKGKPAPKPAPAAK